MGMAFEATPQDEQVGLVKFIQAKSFQRMNFYRLRARRLSTNLKEH